MNIFNIQNIQSIQVPDQSTQTEHKLEEETIEIKAKTHETESFKPIDNNTVILFFNHDEKNVYYSVIEKRIKFQSENHIPQSGFIVANGEPQEYTDLIMKMIK